MHPAGSFDAEILDHGYSKSRGKGSDQFFVVFQTEAGTITGFFSLSDKAITYTIEKIRNMEFQGDDLGDLADGHALRGNQCSIVVDHEEFDGKINARVGFVNPLGQTGGAIERDATAANNARRFNALLKRKPALRPIHAQITRSQQQSRPPVYDEEPPPYDDETYPPGPYGDDEHGNPL